MDALVAVALGVVVGTATGMVPGLHVNLLAALALTIPDLPTHAALAILAIGTVHTFVAILPATYLGAPGDGLSVLPAHRLLRAGSGPEAIRLSLAASLAAAMGALLMLWPYQLALTHPATLPFLATVAPFVLAALPLFLVLRDARPAAAASCVLLASAIGHLAWEHPVAGWLPGSPLLPLLSGLFGIPTLLWAMRSGAEAHRHDAPPRHLDRSTMPATIRGLAAAAWTAVLPGLTAAVASSMAMPRGSDPRRALATLSAVNTAHLMLTMGVLWITGATRSGLAIAWQTIQPVHTWMGAPPPDLLLACSVMLASGLAAVGLTVLLDRPYRRVLGTMRPGAAEGLALATIVALVAATTGWSGVVLLVAASLVGFVPLVAGTRRIHLAAALSIPIAFRIAFA